MYFIDFIFRIPNSKLKKFKKSTKQKCENNFVMANNSNSLHFCFDELENPILNYSLI